jgi:RNA polymerase primary sigma factor
LELTTSEVVDTLISGRHVSVDAPFVQGEETACDVLENEDEDSPDGVDERRSARRRAACAGTLTKPKPTLSRSTSG